MINESWDQANKQYTDLWTEAYANGSLPTHTDSPHFRWPVQYGPFEKHSLVFVGLNPAFNRSYFAQIETSDDVLTWTAGDPYPSKKAQLIEGDEIALGKTEGQAMYPYFRPLDEISRAVESTWEHVDLFGIRETKQNLVAQMVGIYPEDPSKLQFREKMYDIFVRLITAIAPRLIVVVNALASRIIRNKNGLPNNWRDDSYFYEHGYHLLKFGEEEFPVLFSGMLSGQRALDIGSRERLAWTIGNILRISG